MTVKQIKAYIKKVKWQTARDKSHAYTVKKWNPGLLANSFEKVVMHIRENGYPGFFGKVKYMYFDVDGYKYWSMGAPLKITIIINRAKLGG